MRRVVVTGLGLVTPLASGVQPTWDKLVAGESGAGPITRFDPKDMPAKIAAQVPRGDAPHAFRPDEWMDPKEQRRVDDFIIYGVGAASQALDDSGWKPESDEDRCRSGVLIGSGIGGLPGIEEASITLKERGPRRISPFFVPGRLINLVSGYVSIKYGLKGPNHAVVTACSTGAHAIGDAARLIMLDDANVMVAGGAGFVMGEGAGCVVLEEYEHAKKRGAPIYAEIVGYGLSGDAYHITAPAEDGNGAFRCMQMALKRAKLNPDDIDYINAHGTSTPLGDEIELGAVKRLFGNAIGRVSMSSTKSSIGHLLGAAGAVEAIFSILAIRNGVVPPTLNLDNPCDGSENVDLVPRQAKQREVRAALSNSFGFGGTNASLIFKRAN